MNSRFFNVQYDDRTFARIIGCTYVFERKRDESIWTCHRATIFSGNQVAITFLMVGKSEQLS